MSAISRSELLVLHNELSAKARELMTKKNHDYAVEQDVFRNFRTFGTLGVLVRLSDKLARLRSFEENNVFKVTDEALIDTILDTINYAVIYFAMKQEDRPEPTAPTGKLLTRLPAWPEIKAILKTAKDIPSGPYCSICTKNPADFQERGAGDERSEVFWCSDCAARNNVDTSEMYLMESVA